MNVKTIENFIALDPEIAAKVSSDYVMPNLAPLSRLVELLVDVSITSERCVTDNAS